MTIGGNLNLALKIHVDLKQAHDELGRLTNDMGTVDRTVSETQRDLASFMQTLARIEQQPTSARADILSSVLCPLSPESEAALMRFADQYRKLREDFEKAGDIVGLAKLGDYQTYVEAAEGLRQVEAALSRLQDVQSRTEQSIQTDVELGLSGEIEGRERLLELHRATYAELLKIRPELERLAELPGEVGEKATALVAELDDQMKRLKSTTTLLEETLTQGLKRGLSEAIAGLAKGTMSLKDAVRSLAQTVLDQLAKIAADDIVQSLLGRRSGSSGGSGGGLFGWFGGLFRDLLGFAEGGRLPGRSPHDRADNLLFLGTAGEYVTRRKITRQPGAISFLDDFNAVGMPAIEAWSRRMKLIRRADGGLLPAPPSLAQAWSPASAQVSAGPASDSVEIHLTMNGGAFRFQAVRGAKQSPSAFFRVPLKTS